MSYKPRRLPTSGWGYHSRGKNYTTDAEEIAMQAWEARLEPPDEYGGDGYDCEECGEPYADERRFYGILCDECHDECLREAAEEAAFDRAREGFE